MLRVQSAASLVGRLIPFSRLTNVTLKRISAVPRIYLMRPHASPVEGCPDTLIGEVAFPSFEDVMGASFSSDREAVAHLIEPLSGFTNSVLSMD